MLAPEDIQTAHSEAYIASSSNRAGRQQTWRLRNWIILGYSIPVTLAFLSAAFVYRQVRLVREDVDTIVEQNQATVAMSIFAFNVQTMSRATRGYLLAPSPVSENSYQTARETIEQVESDLVALLKDPAQQQTFTEILGEVDELDEADSRLIAQARRGDREGAIAAWGTEQGRDHIEHLADLITQFFEREQVIVDLGSTETAAAMTSLSRTVWGSALISLCFAITVGAWIVITVTRRMNATASTLATSTNQIAATIEQQERTASQQAASVNETTTTMDELGASSRQSSEQADAAARAAQQALDLADGGTRAVDKTLTSMNDLRDKVSAIATQIVALSEQTNQIGSISQLVSDLANQTNMLALNAAVEAVRAGEHGKGFSVVAAEIRKLADQSKQSAQKISNLVGDIQRAIESTVAVTDEGTQTVESGAAIAQQTAEAFVGVADAINNVVLNNQQISLNIRQQTTAIEQVVQAMNAINQGAKETASGISQTKLGTQALQSTTASLTEMV
ncbi:MAG: methyl-accepting chemotaxis protein [Spirulinaceae cyanobacterium SM2_1_0]|nr:methyl-accepting chemotaxis protein [Spirulinaceae cyanobacterium SM2_1_0]